MSLVIKNTVHLGLRSLISVLSKSHDQLRCLLSSKVLREDSIIVINVLLNAVLHKLLSSASNQLGLLLSLDLVLVKLILEFLLDGLIFHRKLDTHNGTVILENLDKLLLVIVAREVSHNDCSMIKDLILKVLTRFHLDLFVIKPDIPKAFPEDLDLSGGANFDIGKSLPC